MAEYYTKAEADARYSLGTHTHPLEELGGELTADRVVVSEEVAASFGNAYFVDEAFASAADQLAGKAPTNHTHTGYASTGHTHAAADITGLPATYTHPENHPASMITGLAEVATTGSYADLTGKPTIPSIPASLPADGGNADTVDGKHASDFATSDHTHSPAAVGSAPAVHTHDYAAPTHSHSQEDITGLEATLAAKAPNSALSGKADLVDGKVPASQLPGYVDDVEEYATVSDFPATGESGKLYVATGTNKTYRWSGTTYVEVAGGVALGETSATAYRGDRGKEAYDHSQNGDVHVTTAEKNTWNGKAPGNHTHTAAEVGAATANHGHSYNDLSDKPTIPAAYSHPTSHPASMISGLSEVATSGNYNDLTNKPTIPTIPSSLPANGGNADTVDGKHASDFATSDHGHTAADVGALPLTGGILTGPLTTGAYTYTAQITPFDGGSYAIGTSERRYYSTYLRVNPNVSSDRRCKRDIFDMDIAALAAFVDKLNVVSYNYKDDAGDEPERIGLIAQDVVAADPNIAKGCVEQDEKGFYSLRTADLVYPMIAAIQALTKRVEELEQERMAATL